jgi:hypothetical protein
MRTCELTFSLTQYDTIEAPLPDDWPKFLGRTISIYTEHAANDKEMPDPSRIGLM